MSKVVAQPLLQRLCCSSLAIVSKVVAQPLLQRLCCTSLHDRIAYCPSLQNRHCTITVAQARSVVAVQPKPWSTILFATGRTPSCGTIVQARSVVAVQPKPWSTILLATGRTPSCGTIVLRPSTVSRPPQLRNGKPPYSWRNGKPCRTALHSVSIAQHCTAALQSTACIAHHCTVSTANPALHSIAQLQLSALYYCTALNNIAHHSLPRPSSLHSIAQHRTPLTTIDHHSIQSVDSHAIMSYMWNVQYSSMLCVACQSSGCSQFSLPHTHTLLV